MVEIVRKFLERLIYMSVNYITKPTIGTGSYVMVRRNNVHTILHFFLRFCMVYMQYVTYKIIVDASMTRYIKKRAATVRLGAIVL